MTSLSSNPNPRDQQLQNNLRYESIQRIVAEYPSGEAQSLIERHIATYENELFELSNEKLINLYQALVFLSLDAQVEDPLFSRYVLTLTSCFCSYGMELPSDLIHERVQGAFVAKLGALLEAEQVEFSTFADAMLIAVVLCDDSFYLKEPFIASLSERIDGTARAGFSLDNLRFYVDQLDERVWELALSTNSLREKLFDSVCKNLTENIISPDNALMVLEQLDSRELFLHPQYLSAASLYISNNLNMGCFLLQAIRAFPRADDNILEFHPSAQEYLPNPALAKSTLLYVLDCLEQEKGRTIQYVRAAVEFVRICGQADFLQSDIFQERAQAILEQWVCEPSAMSVTYKDSDNYLALYELVPAELQARLPNPIEEGNKFLISLNKNAEQQGRHYSKIITESEWNRHVDFAMTDFMSGKLLSFEQRILTMSQAIKQVNFSQNGLHDRWLEFQTICFMPLSPEDRASELVNLFLSINHTTDKGESELIGYQGMCVPYSCALIPIFDSLSEAKEELGLEEEAAALQAIVQAIMDYHDTSIPDEGIFQALRASYDAPGVAEILGLSRAELGDWTMGI